MLKGIANRRPHIFCLGQRDQRTHARTDRNLGFVAVLLNRKNYFARKIAAQNFLNFVQAGFNFLAVSSGNFVVPAGVFNIHQLPPITRPALNRSS
jgi:hypothetical protein